MKRRAAGDGSIYRVTNARGKTSYRGSLSFGFDPETGKRLRKTVTRQTRPKVVAELDRLKRERDAHQPTTPDRLTLGVYLTEWLSTHGPAIRESSAVRYAELIRAVPPSLAAVPLGKLQPEHLERAYATLARRWKPGTVLKFHRMLHAALARLEKRQQIRNVAAMAEAPRDPKREVRTLSFEEVGRLLAAIAGDRNEALYILAISTGLRQGEILALRWEDIDWDAPAVSVRGSLRRLPSDGLRRRETKTTRARRVELTPSAVAALHQHRERQAVERLRAGPGWEQADLIFPNEIGRPVERTVLIRQWYRVCDRAGLSRIPFKDATRHATGSLLIAGGVPMKVVSEVLGHSSITITADRYSHILPGVQAAAAVAMELALQQARATVYNEQTGAIGSAVALPVATPACERADTDTDLASRPHRLEA